MLQLWDVCCHDELTTASTAIPALRSVPAVACDRLSAPAIVSRESFEEGPIGVRRKETISMLKFFMIFTWKAAFEKGGKSYFSPVCGIRGLLSLERKRRLG